MVGVGLIATLYALEYLLLLAVVFTYMPAFYAGLTRVFWVYFNLLNIIKEDLRS